MIHLQSYHFDYCQGRPKFHLGSSVNGKCDLGSVPVTSKCFYLHLGFRCQERKEASHNRWHVGTKYYQGALSTCEQVRRMETLRIGKESSLATLLSQGVKKVFIACHCVQQIVLAQSSRQTRYTLQSSIKNILLSPS